MTLLRGYDALIGRVRALAGHPERSEDARGTLTDLLDYHEDDTVTRETAQGCLACAERHLEIYRTLERQTGDRDIPVADLPGYPAWREAVEMLVTTGEAVLSNQDRYGPYLDALSVGMGRARLTVEQLRNRLPEDRVEAPAPEEGKPRARTTPQQQQGFAHKLDDSEKLRELREKAGEPVRKRGIHQRSAEAEA